MANKGAGFERAMAKRLSLWWTRGKRDDVLWRTSQSGGRATTRRKSGKKTANQEGDLCYTDKIAKPLTDYFYFELKTGYTNKKEVSKEEILKVLNTKFKNDDDAVKAVRKLLKKARRTKSKIDPLDFIDSNEKILTLLQWWIKAENEKVVANKIATIVIFKRDGKIPCVMFDHITHMELHLTSESEISFRSLRYPYSLFIIPLEEFLTKVKPYMIKKLIRLSKEELS